MSTLLWPVLIAWHECVAFRSRQGQSCQTHVLLYTVLYCKELIEKCLVTENMIKMLEKLDFTFTSVIHTVIRNC